LKKPITKKGLVEWLKVQALSSNSNTTKKINQYKIKWLRGTLIPSSRTAYHRQVAPTAQEGVICDS
jgi:hypothetical protein